ncbi:MAG: bifunctional 5,10-methylenetetrahydrofolate dehydrogenase/5,10-methenyltetrahydrofolate cyclohydrolase [Oscillospiraceae bacterium]|nr:bifunctional 5,10-methylenetetrahydrofolate dehydrogenase/5,10-methenyltetrahydrofolate cyclohydrolase [Oscillospiraceae bacterium]MBQ4538671.1 bifunctional 5,10-methylenetetrahydrofolate dehydrogenase/5,10-methenyltetrahydrofolate cyclohydrolase [Oscillospiraceae bacterium]
MAILLKGAPAAAKLTEQALQRSESLRSQGIAPTLAIVRMGERDDDLAYQRGAQKRCEKAQVEVKVYALPEDASQSELLSLIQKLNDDNSIHGVLIMRPMPKHIDDEAVTNALSPEKDVDGITPGAMAALYAARESGFAPCTARACVEILKHYEIPLLGRQAVVVGRSLVIGKPVSQLLLKENMTVTTCHSRSQNLEDICKRADIIVAAAGKAGMITADFLSEGQTVLDVGIHSTPEGGLCGDVKTEEAAEIVYAVTPVPGGVGAVTSSVLALHVVTAAERISKKER